MRGGARAHSYQMHMYFTQMGYNPTYADKGDVKYPRDNQKICPLKEYHMISSYC